MNYRRSAKIIPNSEMHHFRRVVRVTLELFPGQLNDEATFHFLTIVEIRPRNPKPTGRGSDAPGEASLLHESWLRSGTRRTAGLPSLLRGPALRRSSNAPALRRICLRASALFVASFRVFFAFFRVSCFFSCLPKRLPHTQETNET